MDKLIIGLVALGIVAVLGYFFLAPVVGGGASDENTYCQTISPVGLTIYDYLSLRGDYDHLEVVEGNPDESEFIKICKFNCEGTKSFTDPSAEFMYENFMETYANTCLLL